MKLGGDALDKIPEAYALHAPADEVAARQQWF